MFTGRALTADEAQQADFVSRVVQDLENEKQSIAESICNASPLVLRLSKRTIDRGIELDPAGAREAEIEAIEEQLRSGSYLGKA